MFYETNEEIIYDGNAKLETESVKNCFKNPLETFPYITDKSISERYHKINYILELIIRAVKEKKSSKKRREKNSKAYWSLIKSFQTITEYHNPPSPSFPHYFMKINSPETFKKKPDTFNSFFAKQCTVIKFCSNIPSKFQYALNLHNFIEDDTLKIIRWLDPDMDHGHDILSIHMLKICGKPLYKLLLLNFNQCIITRRFSVSDYGKKAT